MKTDQHTDRLFHALADATRRDIVQRTIQEEHSVSALARNYPMSVAAVQKHVAVLVEAGLVSKHRHGREQLVRARPDALIATRRVLDDLETLWRSRIARFEHVLAESEEGAPT